jgi:hypothetical protein
VSASQFGPGPQARSDSDAIVATNAGHTLASLFYLRTLIEQHMRSIVRRDDRLRGDDLSTTYAKTLDKDIRSRLPSFAELYEKLSAALHAARDDDELFTECLQASRAISKRRPLLRKLRIPANRSENSEQCISRTRNARGTIFPTQES